MVKQLCLEYLYPQCLKAFIIKILQLKLNKSKENSWTPQKNSGKDPFLSGIAAVNGETYVWLINKDEQRTVDLTLSLNLICKTLYSKKENGTTY